MLEVLKFKFYNVCQSEEVILLIKVEKIRNKD